ncbi:hypothetical protein [Gilliamella sp. App2-1]|uniref:hypothetical protein n=1 Tax=Gilliamella sp. App2-1 TaxID=3120230 RepID=UPI0011471738|nr:hypothetical protein [Gilliamella apicola]
MGQTSNICMLRSHPINVISLHVRLFIDAELSNDKIKLLWMETLGKIIYHPVSFAIEEPSY